MTRVINFFISAGLSTNVYRDNEMNVHWKKITKIPLGMIILQIVGIAFSALTISGVIPGSIVTASILTAVGGIGLVYLASYIIRRYIAFKKIEDKFTEKANELLKLNENHNLAPEKLDYYHKLVEEDKKWKL